MNILFVTGCNSPFFNSLLVCLQSFAERLPGHRLLVCDFGLTSAQANFLRGLGLWLAQPPNLERRGVFDCKAALISYLRHGGHKVENYDAMVWLDADLTLMDVGIGDFEAVISAIKSAGVPVAICPEPAGRTIAQMISLFADASAIAPFARTVADTGIDAGAPYLSTGLFFCGSAALLDSWEELTRSAVDHPLYEQNMFNVALRRDSVAFMALDCEEWQAQGRSLDQVRLVAAERGRPAARIGTKNIKTLHATSPASGHLLIATCRMTVRDLVLTGPFKLLFAEPLRLHQLQLLASFMVQYADALLRSGVCHRAERPVEGFEFVTL